MEVNETMKLSGYWHSSKNRLNGFENGKTQLFNNWGKGAYFQKKKKKVEYPFKCWLLELSQNIFLTYGFKVLIAFIGSSYAVV